MNDGVAIFIVFIVKVVLSCIAVTLCISAYLAIGEILDRLKRLEKEICGDEKLEEK